jgi:hypothetical protein
MIVERVTNRKKGNRGTDRMGGIIGEKLERWDNLGWSNIWRVNTAKDNSGGTIETGLI